MDQDVDELLVDCRSITGATSTEKISILDRALESFARKRDFGSAKRVDEEIRRLLSESADLESNYKTYILNRLGLWKAFEDFDSHPRDNTGGTPFDLSDASSFDWSDDEDEVDLDEPTASVEERDRHLDDSWTKLKDEGPRRYYTEEAKQGIPKNQDKHGDKIVSEVSIDALETIHEEQNIEPKRHQQGIIPPTVDDAVPLSIPKTVHLSKEGERAAVWFNLLATKTHPFIEGSESRFTLSGPKRIKIAVLDTGIARSTEFELNNLAAFRARIEKGKSFVGKPWDEDDCGHGTAVASLMARTAPNAKLYIARVASEVNKIDKDAVAKAIRHAVNVWKVDVINMSFGWEYSHQDVENALDYAQRDINELGKSKQRTLLLAATSNSGVGHTQEILYPSRSQYVISVDSADGLGNEAGENSSSDDKTGNLRFTAPGVDVPCNFPLKLQPSGTEPGTEVPQTGASFACAVASGVAALVLEFARQEPCSWVSDIEVTLKRKWPMEMVFLKMSKSKSDRRFRFLHPWRLLVGSARDAYGGDASPHTPRWDQAYKIARGLEREYGADWGGQFIPAYEKAAKKKFGHSVCAKCSTELSPPS